MEEIRRYTDRLFEHVALTDEVKELKAEIYSNMEAKVMDLVENGLPKNEAIRKAQADLVSIDGLLDSIHAVDYHQFRLDCLMDLLLASLIIWILAIPTLMVQGTIAWLALGCVLVVAVKYMKEKSAVEHNVRYLSIKEMKRGVKRLWKFWSLMFTVGVLTVTAVQFGSNIWFLRTVTFQGPYDFANQMVWYYLSVITVIVPIAVSRFPQHLIKRINGGAK